MASLPDIAGLWVGPRLSFLEQLSIRSYLDAGHAYTLYASGPVEGLPEGALLGDMADILAPPFDILDQDRLRVVCYSNLFRMELFQKTDAIWADLDTYCVRALADEATMVVGRTHNAKIANHVNTSTLRLDRGSKTLAALQTFYALDNPVPPWEGTRFGKRVAQFQQAGRNWRIQDLPWGASGHRALTHFLTEMGEIEHAQPVEAFHSIHTHNYAMLLQPMIAPTAIEIKGAKVLHFFGQLKNILRDKAGGRPPPNSYLAALCDRHHIHPDPL